MGNALRIALLALAAMAFAIGTVELVLRLLPASTPPPRVAPDPALAGLPELRTIAEIARPNARGVHHGVLHRTNRLGARGPEYSPRPAADVFRVVAVGDSYTMGHGVDERQTWPARLEQRLGDQTGRRIEVINIGLSGLAARGVAKRLARAGLPYHPDFVIYGFNVNDIYGPAFEKPDPELRLAYQRRLDRFQEHPLRLLRLVWPRFMLLRSGLWPEPGSHEHGLERGYFENPAAWATVADAFARLAAIQEERELCVHVFVLPVVHQLYLLHPFQRIYEHVEAAARERGLTVTQGYPAIRGHDALGLRIGGGDIHPNAAGYELLADGLLDGLRELPPACGLDLR